MELIPTPGEGGNSETLSKDEAWELPDSGRRLGWKLSPRSLHEMPQREAEGSSEQRTWEASLRTEHPLNLIRSTPEQKAPLFFPQKANIH